MSTISSVKNQTGEVIHGVHSLVFLKFPWATILGTISWLVGGQNVELLGMVMVLIGIDLVTAVVSQLKNGLRVQSRKALKTATKAVVYACMVAGAHLAGVVTGVEFLETIALSFLAVTELISILENIGKMGYAIPNKLLDKLVEIRDK